MKNNTESIGLLLGKGDATTKEICRCLAKEGVTAIVKSGEAPAPEPDPALRHWSGQPGKDLFFNGWKLLF